VDDLTRTACKNLIDTYLMLGDRSGEVRRIECEPGSFFCCTGNVPHPVCNFAVDLHLEGGALQRLCQIAKARKAFNVYQVSTDSPDDAAAQLKSCGFHEVCSLALMAWRPAGPTAEPVAMERMQGEGERRQAASFMANQFFSHQAPAVRKLVASATCAAEGVELYTMSNGSGILGGVMVSDTGGACGLYNLCVIPERRGRGHGSAIVAAVKSVAAGRSKAVVLQCDPSLQDWYAGQGFEAIGAVKVHALRKNSLLDIMG
jgi:GNAT superfamily N-acetyltransferase